MSIFSALPLALGITLLLKVATIVPALVLASIVDSLSNSSTSLLALFLLLIGIQAMLLPLQAWCLARLCQERVRLLSILWCRELLNKHFEAYGQLQGGTLVKVLDRGITAQEQWLNFLVNSAWPVLAEALILGGLFIYLGAGWALLGLLPLSLLYLWLNGMLIRWRRPQIEAVNAREDDLAEQWVDTFASAACVKLEGAEGAAMVPVARTLGAYADTAVRVATSGAWLQAAKVLFIGLGSGGLLAWGLHDQTRSTPALTLGELVALFTLVGGLLAGIAQAAEAWRMLDQYKVDRQKLERWLKMPVFGGTIASLDSDRSGLCLQPCSLKHGNARRLEISCPLYIHPGERVALIGPSGSGKSTLLHALAGIIQPLRHQLILNGTAASKLEPRLQLSQLRLTPQEPRFLPGTLPTSVLFDQSHQRPEIERWLTQLGLTAQWYERTIDARGENVSGGEARRLSLLRLLNRPGAYNLLDEPTRGLDAETAARAWELIFSTFEGRGLICVTHDLSALSRFDRIIRLELGRVISIETVSDRPGSMATERDHSSSKL